MIDNERIAVEFTLYELYYLQSIVRHEMPNLEQWKAHPPVSEALNLQIAMEAERIHEPDGTYSHEKALKPVLELTRHDTLVIDYYARFDAKYVNEQVGKGVLLKAYRARKQLDLGFPFETTAEHDKKYVEVKTDAESSNDADAD